ncbi:MAG: ABC transporter substrate-binding protein [Halolamina sp.]|uniref:ABC transporter substrate-binding protein n=1 Tax=Halolamina sp. TaxID=1940283 RepID=UPI002FC393F8
MTDEQTRRRFLTTTVTGTAAAVAGCAGGGSSDGDPTTTDTQANDGTTGETNTEGANTGGSDGGTLKLASAGQITSMDPVVKGVGGIDQWGETLVGFDNGRLPAQALLAESFEVSDDGTTYRFKLKEGVRFHDGSELTASDIVYSWERLAQSPETQNNDDLIGGTFTVDHEKDKSRNDPEKSEFADYVAGTLAVRAPEKYVFEFDLRAPFHSTLAQIGAESSFIVYPENTVGDIERDDVETDGKFEYQEAFGTEGDGPNIVGTGPFQIDRWSKGDELRLTRHEEYHGDVANIDAVEIVILPDGDAIYQRAENGNLDIFEIPSSKFDPGRRSELEDIGGGRQVGSYEMENGTEVNTAQVGDLGVHTIIFNCKKVPKPVRKGLALAINQHELANQVWKDQEPAYVNVPPEVYPGWDTIGDFDTPADAHEAHYTEGAMSQTPWGADGYQNGIDEARISEARELIRDAGLEGGEYTFTVYNDQGPAWDDVATRVQQKGEAIGLNITIERANYGTVISQGIFEHKLDFHSLGDSMEWPESDNLLRFFPPQVAIDQVTQWGEKNDDGSWVNEVQQVTADTWDENYLKHRGPGDANRRNRDKAYLTLMEANMETVYKINLVYRVNRTYWSTDLDYDPPGVMGDKQYNGVSIDRS